MSHHPSNHHRDELLRRIGRNIVNFQRLEALLRSMLPVLSGSGTTSELQANQSRLQRSFKKASLGRLSDAMHQQLYSKPLANANDTPPEEISFSYSMRIEASSSAAEEHKRRLVKLVVARNRLIHKDLVNVNLDSPDECIRLSNQLDKQNDQIREQIQTFNALSVAHKESMSELLRYVQSAAFLEDLEEVGDDA